MQSSVQREVVVDLLRHGDNVPTNIAESIDRHQTSVSRALSDLEDEGHVLNKGRGVWSLTPSGVELAQALSKHEF